MQADRSNPPGNRLATMSPADTESALHQTQFPREEAMRRLLISCALAAAAAGLAGPTAAPAQAQFPVFFGDQLLLPNGTKLGTPPGTKAPRYYPPQGRATRKLFRPAQSRRYVPTTQYYYTPQPQQYYYTP